MSRDNNDAMIRAEIDRLISTFPPKQRQGARKKIMLQAVQNELQKDQSFSQKAGEPNEALKIKNAVSMTAISHGFLNDFTDVEIVGNQAFFVPQKSAQTIIKMKKIEKGTPPQEQERDQKTAGSGSREPK